MIKLRLPTLLLMLCTAVAFRARAEQVVPPQPIEMPPATAPENTAQAAEVVLLVTIGTDGTVHDVSMAQSAGSSLDAAAIAAVIRWKFKPALRDGQPFEARVKIPFRFAPAPPESPPAPTTPSPSAIPSTSTIPTTSTTSSTSPSTTTTPSTSKAASPPPTSPPPADAPIEEVSVRGHQRKLEHGGSDFVIDPGQLAVIPRKNAEQLLELAPGIFLANEGGEGHAEQVFLRGYNAEEGQAIEFTLGGMPINEVDNPDSHGYADTHFIIPELVKGLDVIEGPFDPHQGDFAVAGSARYELGVKERGLRSSETLGSFSTSRTLALWAPQGEREGTFAAAQFSSSAGFGDNRASESATAMAGYEGELGERGTFKLLTTAYSTHYESAGVVRADDVASGRIGFYGTEDPSQGGDASRYSLLFDLESPSEAGVLSAQTFLTWRTLRIVEDFTGFLLDNQEQGQSLHPQRGDAVEKDYTAFTAGARASDRFRFSLLGRESSLEAGLYARYDHTTPSLQRLRFGTQIPYLTDLDLVTDITNIAGYIDADLRPLSFLTLRGGVRQELFAYDVLNNCATAGDYRPTQPLNESCPNYDASGPRLPGQRTTASGQLFEPKATALVALPLGLTLTGSYGIGAQSIDPTSLEQNENAPFIKLRAAEGGLLAKGHAGDVEWSGRGVAFLTKADQDLIFDPSQGRLAPSSATTRTGLVFAGRATSRLFDEAASFTVVHPTFDDDGTLVPYTPLAIARSDTALFGVLPWFRPFDRALHGTLGLGVGYVGKRALPFSQFATPTVQLDASASVRGGPFKLALAVTNLTNQQFPLSEFFYASDFHSRNYPTLAPAAHFTAAPPRILLLTLEIALGHEEEQ